MPRYIEKNYTLDIAAKKITFLDYTTIDIKDILLVLNLKLNKEIYNIADSNRTGTVSGNELTFVVSTIGMLNSDDLQIWLHVSKFSVLVEEDSGDPDLGYVGKAIAGVDGADPYWQIALLDESSGTGLVTTQADGNDNFDNIWNDRESLTYS